MSLTADATPCLARGSDATIALVAGVIASAAPTPITMVTSMKARKPLPVPRVANSANPIAETARPMPPISRWPYRSDSVPATAEIGRITMLIGNSATRGFERAVAEHELQELQRHEEEAEHGEELQEQRRRSGGEARGAEQPRVEQWLVGAQLHPDEPHEER